jgi:hypothetical protein
MFDWILQNKDIIIAIGIISVITFVGSLIMIPVLVVNIREDYFIRKERDFKSMKKLEIFLYFAALVFKNILGILFILAGIAMLVLPGQGILTILLGVSLVNFPGKRKLELELVQREAVHKAINWIREKAGKKPLIIPED